MYRKEKREEEKSKKSMWERRGRIGRQEIAVGTPSLNRLYNTGPL